MLRVACVCTLIIVHAVANASNNTDSLSKQLRRLGGAGCPYFAAWLAAVELHYRVKYWLHSTKMEAATFLIADRAKQKYQFMDPDAFFVHHLSRFEHAVHKKEGLESAREKTLLMSTLAFNGECGSLTTVGNTSYFVVIPFYGGLPPDVDQSHVVRSLGQGNSLMDPGVKILQTMATLCSAMQYFGQGVIAVAQEADRLLVEEALATLHPSIGAHVRVLLLSVGKPANLPFHALAWSQTYVKALNCRLFYTTERACATHSGVSPVHDGAFNVTLLREANVTMQAPVAFVYYSESDQILRFSSTAMLDAISAASNASCLFFGRRKEKTDRDPSGYMRQLDEGRACGATGFELSWPESRFVHATTTA